ncbi:alpha/beta hydrolase [Salinisphaera sp.]|uniref:RBBP9/YdeN family alpha/beta hydrolase n=1 Tax=Salinisphaera sp. TaxID=1914330 RepID=UPI002D781256|nr:alpha/beta hydrolase [Salinisphaera sp.]HET7314398.1 alpha/beta hydrolase [Salinisphaera sp.]
MNINYLIVPGLDNSDDRHWQSRWEKTLDGAVRVNQRDWQTPDLPVWSAAIEAVLRRAARPPMIIAHSFGCLAAVHAAARYPASVAGLFLAAPADPDRVGNSQALPYNDLPMPSLLIASTNDPWLSSISARSLANQWGSVFVNAGRVGHLNPASGYGPWPEGWARLHQLIHTLDLTSRASNIA